MTVVQLCGVHGTQIGQLVCAQLQPCMHVHMHEERRGSGVEGGGGGVVENSIKCTGQ